MAANLIDRLSAEGLLEPDRGKRTMAGCAAITGYPGRDGGRWLSQGSYSPLPAAATSLPSGGTRRQ
jgi:hypothetical protein